jgi:putative chitinase
MRIPASLLISLGAKPANAEPAADAISAALTLNGVDRNDAAAAFLGQCAIESDGFNVLQESLHYTTDEVAAKNFAAYRALPFDVRVTYLRNSEKMANLVYAGRFGNGDEASGDGWRFAGKGYIQTTFRNNYLNAQTRTNRPYVKEPTLLLQPSDAALAAVSYFVWKKGPMLALQGLNDETLGRITATVNPAMLKSAERAAATRKAYLALTKGIA